MTVVLFANTSWYLYNFRASLARTIADQGHKVVLLSPPGPYAQRLLAMGMDWRSVPLARNSLNAAREVGAMIRLVRLYRQIRPDVVHHFTLECIVLGTVAATLTRVPAIVNAVAGLGSNFTGSSVRAHLLRSLLGAALKMAFNRSRVIFQNPDDFEALHRIGLLRGTHAHVIRGSGVDTARFLPSPKPYAAGRGTVLLASRLLWAKGIGDFVQAARLVQARLSGLRFVVAGVADSGSPGSIPERQIAAWREEGTVEFLGHCDEMSLLLGNVDLVVLPTYYGEGVPRILLEAAASGLATVATDMPGCREITRHGHSGLLVPPRDPVRLAEAVEELMLDPDRRARMGARGRELVCAEFSEAQVNEATLKVYVAAMGDSRRRRKAGR